MPAVKLTASSGSGYMTNALFDVAIGPFRCFTAHFSHPTAASAYVDPGMPTIRYVKIQGADETTYAYLTNSAGGVTVYWSGVALGQTGYIFILGD